MLTGGLNRDAFDGGKPEDPPDEETDIVTDWDQMPPPAENCSSANGCEP